MGLVDPSFALHELMKISAQSTLQAYARLWHGHTTMLQQAHRAATLVSRQDCVVCSAMHMIPGADGELRSGDARA